MDNLNFYSAWLPAGQQTDRYSSKPGCLRSKNLDIFSSSKSVKATAWSEPTTTDTDIVKQDWKLILKTDWKVYERENGVDTLVVDPSGNFPVYDVAYEWGYDWEYAPAERWTVQDMSVKYDWDEWKSFVIFTDRASFVYSKQKFIFNKAFTDLEYIHLMSQNTFADGWFATWYKFQTWSANAPSAYIRIDMSDAPFSHMPIRIFAVENPSDDATISLEYITSTKGSYYYDAQTDSMVRWREPAENIPFTWNILQWSWVTVDLPVRDSIIEIKLSFTKREWKTTWKRPNGKVYIDMNWWPSTRAIMTLPDGTKSDWDCNYYYTYLPLRERKLVDIGTYAYSSSYWMKGTSFQPLYKWSGSWIELELWNKKIVYDFVADMWWESDVSMDVIWMVVWNEQVYMIWNLDWNWYIIPCDLSWSRWTPFIAYWCTFKGVTNIDYLMYLVWEDRWVSQLWVFNNQELVSAIWWKLESQYNDIVWVEEQYKFDWKILNWRKNLILTTTDNRIFQYGQTYGGKGGTFIHELPENATITWLKTNWDDLEVDYSITEGQTTTKYSIKYQDDTPIKNYNTQWEATYPIVIWNHLLEKEESDLYCSYILPSAETSLEFWGMANHYHFWTFKTDWNTTPTAWSSWIIDWADWNYHLEFVEKNWEYLTFKLVWDLPVMTGDETMRLTEYLTMQEPTYIWYTEFNHFRKIWEITTTEYQEWEFRFHNLNNKLELPKSHSLQIMVKGKGNQDYTPELFALDLVANQRERW